MTLRGRFYVAIVFIFIFFSFSIDLDVCSLLEMFEMFGLRCERCVKLDKALLTAISSSDNKSELLGRTKILKMLL